MFTLSSFPERRIPDADADDDDASRADPADERREDRERLHVMIPAFKAAAASIVRETTTTTTTEAKKVRGNSNASSSKSSSSSSSAPPPHVPHEPYKGAVWSKPVRVRGGKSSSATSTPSTPRSSKPPSRTASRLSSLGDNGASSPWAHRCDITIPSHSTVSVLSPPPLPPFSEHSKPISVVSPVKSRASLADDQEEETSLLDDVVGSLTNLNDSTVGSGVDEAFRGSTTEALRVEILRLREENRRLHAMRRSSCDGVGSRRSGGDGVGRRTKTLDNVDDEGGESRSEEDLETENERLKENVKKLTGQLQMQAQVNYDLKKLVIASIGDDLQYRFETISSSRAQLDQEASYLLKSLSDTKEELEKAMIECDVWKSKFMASRVMVDGLASWKAALQLKHTEMERALNLFIEENDNLHAVAAATNRNLSQLSASLRRRYPKLGHAGDDESSTDNKSEKRNLLEIAKENRRIAQSLNFEVEALIKIAADRSLNNPALFPFGAAQTSALSTNSSSLTADKNKATTTSATGANGSALLPTPASSLARRVLLTETTPPKLSNDAIAYLDMLFGPDGQPPEFTFKCCENCNGDIKTL